MALHPVERQFLDAVWHDDAVQVLDLLNRYAGKLDIDVQDESGDTALIRCHNKQMMQILLECDADPNIKNYTEETAMHAAIQMDDDEMVELLIQHGADLTTKTADGTDYITYARLFNTPNSRVVKILENHLRNLNPSNEAGVDKTPMPAQKQTPNNPKNTPKPFK